MNAEYKIILSLIVIYCQAESTVDPIVSVVEEINYLVYPVLDLNGIDLDDNMEMCGKNKEDWGYFDYLSREIVSDCRKQEAKSNLTEAEEEEADKVTEQIWHHGHIENKDYMSLERLYSVIITERKHQSNINAWLEDFPGLVNPLNKNNFMLLLQATVSLSDLKKILQSFSE